jgi:hypothetical protein
MSGRPACDRTQLIDRGFALAMPAPNNHKPLFQGFLYSLGLTFPS